MSICPFIALLAITTPVVQPVPYHAEKLIQAASYEEAIPLCTQALKEADNPQLTARMRCRLMHAYMMLGKESDALSAIEPLIADTDLLNQSLHPDEVLYFHGLLVMNTGVGTTAAATGSLNQLLQQHPNSRYADHALFLLATLSFQNKEYAIAEKQFAEVAERFPHSTHAGNSLFFASVAAAEQHKDAAFIRNSRQRVFQQYPESKYADEAYFTTYSPIEYLQGGAATTKHLQEMSTKYPSSPFLIHALYLLGLSHKNRATEKKETLAHIQHLTDAIDAFQEAESHFQTWVAGKGPIPQEQIDHFYAIYTRARLERAYTNIAIADASKGAKRRIYLEYAIDLLREMAQNAASPTSPLSSTIAHTTSYTALNQEIEYTLAHTLYKVQDHDAASQALDEMLNKYQQSQITRGYFLSRVWYDKGLIAMDNHAYEAAINHLMHAEDAAKGKVLSVDEKLDLWIQQSHCYRKMEQLNSAMLLLSQVINEDAISNQRLKAMFLRAEIYALQGRRELAMNQLKATANKGGEWGQQAQKKLEEDYALL